MSGLPVPFSGYPAQIWATVIASINYLVDFISDNTSISSIDAVADTVLQNVINGLSAINAYNLTQAWNVEITNLQAIQALTISIDATSLSILNNRVSALQSAKIALSALLPQPPFPTMANSIAVGNPSVPDLGILPFYQNFAFETPPVGTTAANLQTQAQQVATSFAIVAAAVSVVQGAHLTQAYDAANRMSQVAGLIASIISSFTSGPISSALPISQLWNTIVALPTFTTDGAIINDAPYLLSVQQSCVIRYALLTFIKQLALFILILRQPVTTNVDLSTLLVGDTLMDVAARSLSNFERWTDIANLNQLAPPYVSPTPGPGVATPGTKLFMPTPGATASPLGVPPNYLTNFLGIDIFLGPINGTMPPWTGEFQTISGYANLAWALGRRLQTTLGDLIYHSDYGSRIPPEVGAVQTSATAGRIAAFGKSCILSDPRVAAVLSATAQLQPNGQVAFKGLVQPAGFGTDPVNINDVLSSAQ